MGRLGSGSRVGLAWVGVFVAGCGSEQFAPPPGLRTSTTSASAGPAKTVFMIIPGPPDLDLETCSLSAQREAGNRQAIFRLSGPGPGDPPTKQAASIRNAAGDGADALVVLANDEPGTSEALAEVAEKGVPVILYGKAVTPKPGKPGYILVAPEPFAISARLILDAVQGDAKKNGRPADGEAIILASSKPDMFAAERVSALKAAAEASKCRKVEVVTFEGIPDVAVKAFVEKYKGLADLSFLLAEGDESLELAIKIRLGLKGMPLTFVGGYAGLHGTFTAGNYSQESAFVEFRPDNLAKLAVRTAVAKASGEEIAALVTLPSKFNRGSGSIEFEVAKVVPGTGGSPEPRKDLTLPSPPPK